MICLNVTIFYCTPVEPSMCCSSSCKFTPENFPNIGLPETHIIFKMKTIKIGNSSNLHQVGHTLTYYTCPTFYPSLFKAYYRTKEKEGPGGGGRNRNIERKE